MNDGYDGYFERQAGRSMTARDIELKVRWFYSLGRFINRKIAITADQRVLEIGSGYGGFYGNLKYKSNYTGLEMDPAVASFTNEHFETDVFKTISFEQFVPDGQFDLVFAFEVLEHLDDPLESIVRIHETLKTSGTFCGTTPYPYAKNIIHDSSHKYVLHPKSWERLFTIGGFSKIDLRPASYIPFLWRLDKRMNPLMACYNPLPYVLSTCLIIAKP